MRRTYEDLRAWTVRVLTNSGGMRAEDADILAASLVDADLRGVHTHGLTRLPIYHERMRRGVLKARPNVRVTRLGPAVATVDADEGPGQLGGHHAMRAAIDIAGEAGAAVVTVSRSAHFGAAAWYPMMAAEAGMVGIAMSHAEADVVPFGGRSPALGTNPLSIASPGPAHAGPLLLDMATSTAAMGKVLAARESGAELPEGWAVDGEGCPTTDPHAARAVVPLGGPKGYGLALLVDVLCSLLTGGPYGTDIPRMYDDLDTPQHLGHVMIAIDVSHFVPLDEFRDRMESLGMHLLAIPPAEGFRKVQLPGQPEHEKARAQLEDGIDLPPAVVAALEGLAAELGMVFPASCVEGSANE